MFFAAKMKNLDEKYTHVQKCLLYIFISKYLCININHSTYRQENTKQFIWNSVELVFHASKG